AHRRGIVVPSLVADVAAPDVAADPGHLGPGAPTHPPHASSLRSAATAPGPSTPGPPSASTPLLSCRGVDVAYGQVQVLFGVDFEVAEGEIVGLLGTNGAGKSTLLKAVSGLLRPGAGVVEIGGTRVKGISADNIAKEGVALVPG